MKRKEAIKKTREGVVQIFNDYHPSTKEIKKFLKEAFPDDYYLEKYPNEVDEISRKYFKKAPYDENFWVSNNGCKKSLPIINLSIITKRKKTKLSQLEKKFSDLAKDVSELRQILAKDVEVDVEEIQQETIKEEEIDFSVQELFIHERGTYIVCSNGKQNLNENTFEGKVIYSTGMHHPVNYYSKSWVKGCFEKFKGELTIK